jgi:hypothetical protein
MGAIGGETSREETSVRVIFFDDMRGSTALKELLAERSDEEAFQELRREHDRLVYEIIGRDGAGEVIKSTGDGLLAVFDKAVSGGGAGGRDSGAVEATRHSICTSRTTPTFAGRCPRLRGEKIAGARPELGFGRQCDHLSPPAAAGVGRGRITIEGEPPKMLSWVFVNAVANQWDSLFS